MDDLRYVADQQIATRLLAAPCVAYLLNISLAPIVILESKHYWRLERSPPLFEKLLIAFITLMLVALWLTNGETALHFLISQQRDAITLSLCTIGDGLLGVWQVCVSAAAQTYLAYRCYRLASRRWFVGAPLMLLVTAGAVAGLWYSINAARNTVNWLTDPRMIKQQHDLGVAYLWLSAGIDVCETITLFLLLRNTIADPGSFRGSRIGQRLVFLAIQTAGMTSFLAVLAGTLFVTYTTATAWIIPLTLQPYAYAYTVLATAQKQHQLSQELQLGGAPRSEGTAPLASHLVSSSMHYLPRLSLSGNEMKSFGPDGRRGREGFNLTTESAAIGSTYFRGIAVKVETESDVKDGSV